MATNIEDTDGDTKVQTEESPDEDAIRFDTAGIERMWLDPYGNFGVRGNAKFNLLTVDRDNDRVGIGTGTPQHTLTVQGSAQFIKTSDADDFMVHGSINNNRIYVDRSADKVGIGTNAPEELLHVSGGHIKLDGSHKVKNLADPTADQEAATKKYVDDNTVGVIPSGGIIIWHGTIANIPAGFVICDGNNGTPNLLTKFVQGVATAATDPGATGGEATHTLTVAELASHSHTDHVANFDQNKSIAGGAPYGSWYNHTYPQTGSTGGGGAHQNEPTFYDVAFIMKT